MKFAFQPQSVVSLFHYMANKAPWIAYRVELMLRIRYKQVCGFTLLELIVVLSIVLALLGLGLPRMVSTMGAMEFRRGVALTINFLRRSHLDAVVKGDTLRL